MWTDPIVEEVRRFRAEHSAKYQNNLDLIVDALRKTQVTAGRKHVSFPPKRLVDNGLRSVANVAEAATTYGSGKKGRRCATGCRSRAS